MSEICGTLAASITKQCASLPKMGMEQTILLFPSAVLPYSGITFDVTNARSLITNIVPESAGFKVEGLLNKDTVRAIVDPVGDQELIDGTTHMIDQIKVYTNTVASQEELNKMLFGGDLFRAVIQVRWGGVGGDNAFRMLGTVVGMKAVLVSSNTNENDGAYIFQLMTPEGHREDNLPHQVLLAAGAAATKTAFGNGFAPA